MGQVSPRFSPLAPSGTQHPSRRVSGSVEPEDTLALQTLYFSFPWMCLGTRAFQPVPPPSAFSFSPRGVATRTSFRSPVCATSFSRPKFFFFFLCSFLVMPPTHYVLSSCVRRVVGVWVHAETRRRKLPIRYCRSPKREYLGFPLACKGID